MSLKEQIKEAGQTQSNILMLNDLANGRVDIVLQKIAKDIETAGKLGKTKTSQLENRQAQIKKLLDNWQDVLNRGSKYPTIKKLTEALLQDINQVAKVAEGGTFKIDKSRYKIDNEELQDFEIELKPQPSSPLETLTTAILSDTTEDEAINSIKETKNMKWVNFLENKNIDNQLKQSFISRVMTENKKNNMIFLNAVPKKDFFNNKENLNNLIKQLKKVQKNPNFYNDQTERAEVVMPTKQSINALQQALKNSKINLYDLTKKTQGYSLLKESEKAKILASINDNYLEKTVEQILAGEEEPIKIKTGKKPGFTQLKADPEKIRLPENIPLKEVILKELNIYEDQLKYNTFKSLAYDKIKDSPAYKKATPNEKNQLLINAIGGMAEKNKKEFSVEVDKLYNYVGKSLGISKPTKIKVIKKLKEGVAESTVKQLEEAILDVNYMKQRRSEIMAKDKATKEETDELDTIMANIKAFEEEAEKAEKILNQVKKGLSLAQEFTKKKVTAYSAPSVRITQAKTEEIEQAQKAPALLPQEIEPEPVALPDINKELLNVKTKTAEIEQKKQNKKPYDQAELETLKIQQLNLENQLRGKRKDKPVPVAKESDTIGAYRPYFPNVTQENVLNANILESIEAMADSLNNFEVFDIPSDNTGGLGTSKNNFLVKDNQKNWIATHDGTLKDIWSWDNYAQDEQKFWQGRPEIDEITAQRQIKYNEFINNDELVTEFLEMFNKNNNGFIDEYQPPEETDKFRNIYMEPSNYYKPTPYSNFADVKNQGFLETDFLNNVNYFVNP